MDNYPIYLAVNADRESQKKGFSKEEVFDVAKQIQTDYADLIQLEGIMCIPSPKHLEQLPKVPKLYLELREIADQIGRRQLSLGMSSDLEAAIEAGSNIIRIGMHY